MNIGDNSLPQTLTLVSLKVQTPKPVKRGVLQNRAEPDFETLERRDRTSEHPHKWRFSHVTTMIQTLVYKG